MGLMDVVQTRDLRKQYGSHEVLHGIDLCVPTGSLFGFLGPNGAGKTTTIRILLGLLRATSGTAQILGADPWRDGPRLRADVGYLPGDLRLWDHLSGRATLAFLDSARRKHSNGEIHRLATALDLDLDKRVRSYSRGMKQKLGVIQALMHRPKLIMMDEPTIALDPLVRETLFTELRRIAGEGGTVLFSSHTLSEVDELCDWVAILRDGELVEQQRIDALRRKAVRRVEITLRDAVSSLPALPDGLKVIRRGQRSLAGSWVGPVQPLVAWLARAQLEDVIIAPPDLEDLFKAYYTGTSSGGAA